MGGYANMKGDYLYKQEMLRKGMKSCIIWMVIIIIFTGIIYMLSLYLMPDSARGKLNEGGVSRPFSVPFYKCPVKIEIEILGSANATFHLTWEANESDYQKKFIARNETDETSTFSFEGELEQGNYILMVKPLNPNDPALSNSKVDFKRIDVYILKPLMPYIFIGAGIIEGLLVIWLITIIIRRRNVIKEMIKANTGKKSGDDYYSRLNEDRSASKHTEYNDLFPKDDGMTSFEKSKSRQYSNDASGLYGSDYKLRKQGKPSLRRETRTMQEREFEREKGPSSAEIRSERRSRKKHGESQSSQHNWEQGRQGSAGRRGLENRSRKRRNDRSASSYDIEYIPPPPRGSSREEYPAERAFEHFPDRKPVRKFEQRKDDDGIDWGASDEFDDDDDDDGDYNDDDDGDYDDSFY